MLGRTILGAPCAATRLERESTEGDAARKGGCARFVIATRTPAPLVATWNRKLGAALDDPEVVAELRPLGLQVSPSSIDDLSLRIFAHRAEWEQRLKVAGLTVN